MRGEFVVISRTPRVFASREFVPLGYFSATLCNRSTPSIAQNFHYEFFGGCEFTLVHADLRPTRRPPIATVHAVQAVRAFPLGAGSARTFARGGRRTHEPCAWVHSTRSNARQPVSQPVGTTCARELSLDSVCARRAGELATRRRALGPLHQRQCAAAAARRNR